MNLETNHTINLPVNITEEAFKNIKKEESVNFKIAFTDPNSGRQLRIYAPKSKLMTESNSRFLHGGGLEICLEFFCQNLQYSDKNP